MKFIFIFYIPCFVSSVITIQPEDTFCCHYATFKEDCHAVCLELTSTKDPVYHQRLSGLLTKNCPKDSLKLVEFWNCLSLYNDSAEAWYGNECCELAMTDQCRTSCLKSKSRAELFDECKPHYEEALHACVYKHESNQKCCRRPGIGSFCRHRCAKSFKSETGPTLRDVASLKSSCDVPTVQCMKNFSETVRLKSMESVKCCEHASNQQCQESCLRILSTEVKDTTIVNRLRESCGEIVPHAPLWRCFLASPKPSPNTGPFVAKQLCCARAESTNCNQLCTKLYGNPWSEPMVWNKFEHECEHNAEELELQECLQEVSEPCTMGCQDLSFCTNFNNRPISLFRNCNSDSDEMARHHFNIWSSGTIRPPTVDIPVKNILECEPEKWKAVACSLQIKPCSSKSGKSNICKSDCLDLLKKCADTTKFHEGIEIEDVCERFSPSHLQENCISISEYSEPRQRLEEESVVSKPCHPNPCDNGQLCIISRKNCGANEKCLKYRCLPGCKMGHGSNFVVSKGAVVRVSDSLRGQGCFKLCICSTSGELRPCVSLPCMDEQRSCKLAGQIREHGENFFVDCNFCSCYHGNVTCTNRQCTASDDKESLYTGLPCNCPAIYEPVCGSNGRSYPSFCEAKCSSRMKLSVTSGSCLKKNPCSSDPCEWKERCVHTPRTCLTDFKNCRQYECLPRYRKCLRLLKSALPLLESKAYGNRRHYSDHQEYQNILSSSHFFSHTALLANGSGICDTNNQQFENICKLTRSKRRKLAYCSRCQESCDERNAEPVCGHDQVTYNHSCMAEANGLLVDHPGECKARRVVTNDADDMEVVCDDVVCPPLSRPGCTPIRPSGACCPLCGAMLRVLINQAHLKGIPQTIWHGPVTMRDVIWLLRSQLHVLECQLYGYLTTEGDMAIIFVSTKAKPSLIQEKSCIIEAERIFNLINNRSPTLTTHLVLSPLIAASVTPTSTGGTGTIFPSYLIISIVLIFHSLFFGCWIT